jgi:hypothetical protein
LFFGNHGSLIWGPLVADFLAGVRGGGGKAAR